MVGMIKMKTKNIDKIVKKMGVFGKFLNVNRQTIGLDIGSSSVKMVVLQCDSQGYIATDAAQAPVCGEQGNPDSNYTAAINKCLESLDLTPRNVVCSLSGPEVAVRQFRFSSVPDEELEDAVRQEAIQVCPFDIEQSAFDFQLLMENTNNRYGADSDSAVQDEVCGVLVAATNKTISARQKLVENNSTTCVLMDVDGLALLNCICEFEKPSAGQSIAILNVGRTFTNMVIVQDDLKPFLRDIPFAAESIIKQISSDKGISESTVEAVLKGREEADVTYAEIEETFQKACRMLTQDIIETLRYYMTQEWSGSVQKTYVCGGFAMAKGFIKLLGELLPGEIILFDPFENIRFGSAMIKNKVNTCGPAFTVAAGLAMRTI
jgi:type IV pilus assembly protein PilM